jgi:hypothetical protein
LLWWESLLWESLSRPHVAHCGGNRCRGLMSHDLRRVPQRDATRPHVALLDATQRNVPQLNATQRNATWQVSASLGNFCTFGEHLVVLLGAAASCRILLGTFTLVGHTRRKS